MTVYGYAQVSTEGAEPSRAGKPSSSIRILAKHAAAPSKAACVISLTYPFLRPA